MTDEPAFNYEEAKHGVEETRTALEHAKACVSRLEQLLTERPRAFGPLAEPAFRLRDHLVADLGTLEAALARADCGAAPVGEQPGFDARNPAEQDEGKPLADRVALGGQ